MQHPDDPNLTAHVLGELPEADSTALRAHLAGPDSRQVQRAIDETRQVCRCLQQALGGEPAESLGPDRRRRLHQAIGAGRPNGWLTWSRGLAAAAAVLMVGAIAFLAVRLDQVARRRDELARAAQQQVRDSRLLDEQLLAATRRVVELQINRDAMHDKLLTLRNGLAELRAIYGNARQVPADLAFYKAMNDSANSLVVANNDEQLEQAADNTLLALTALRTNRKSYPPDQLRQRLGEANGRLDVINAKRAEQRAGNTLGLNNPALAGSTAAVSQPAGQPGPAAISPLAVYAQNLIALGKYDKAIEVLKQARQERETRLFLNR